MAFGLLLGCGPDLPTWETFRSPAVGPEGDLLTFEELDVTLWVEPGVLVAETWFVVAATEPPDGLYTFPDPEDPFLRDVEWSYGEHGLRVRAEPERDVQNLVSVRLGDAYAQGLQGQIVGVVQGGREGHQSSPAARLSPEGLDDAPVGHWLQIPVVQSVNVYLLGERD